MVTVDEKLAFFKENGYWVEHGLLTPSEVAAVLEGMAGVATSDIKIPPLHSSSTTDVLWATDVLDPLMYHPKIMPFVQGVFGPEAMLCGTNWNPKGPNLTDPLPPGSDFNDCCGSDPLTLSQHWQ
jgi:hypothetical protein